MKARACAEKRLTQGECSKAVTQSFAGPCVTTFREFREQSGSQQQEHRASSKGKNIFSAKSETLQSTQLAPKFLSHS